MLRTIQYSFPSKADGLEISGLAVVPELERNEKYRGIIQIVHGMSEYKERYIPFMEYMAERKYISVIHAHEVIFTNNKDAIPDTGLDLNTTPYILALCIVAAGAGVLLFRRRKRWS